MEANFRILDKKIESWKAKFLTKASRATMIKFVLSVIPTYQMSCLPLPKGVKINLDNKLRNIFGKK